ncbi:Two-component sensor histidine kinase, contains HisKA and HATPase domains [Dyadobacter koreensis]|uniref:histidine kinase n=1 Tax=Dyadobacter koreensis TaxID=408657 RepID=A0A1H6YJA0_9BACT|nr:histidine kinase dimerization/phosphoacceptor domain -containing protein [Dyadobacter koreensis]SEJ39047.1 Two-component sensor histidine kinase, contains HisKA and HATPase domains [Dyadobacter koreensis]
MSKQLLPRNILFPMKCFFTLAIICAFPYLCLAQFYPAQPVVPESDLPKLLAVIQNTSENIQDRQNALISLANLYYNKPRKRYEDLDKSAAYAQMVLKEKKSEQRPRTWQEAITFAALVDIDKKEFEQAENLLPQLNGSFKIELMLRLAYAYCEADHDDRKHDWARATELANEVIRSNPEIRSTIHEIQARQIIALVHAKQQQPTAEKELLDIVAQFKKAGSRNYQTTLSALSEYCFHIGDQSRALFYSLEAVKAMKASKDSSMAGDIYANHAMMWTDNDEFDKGVSYINLAIKHYAQRAGRYNLSDPLFLFDVEYIYGKTSRHQQDLKQMKKMLAAAPPQTVSDRIYHNVIMGRIYRRLKKFDKSEIYYKKAYSISKKYGVAVQRTTAGLAQLYADSKQFAKARPFLYQELKFPKYFFNNGSFRHLHYMVYLTDSATGNYYDAIKHLSIYSNISHYDLTQSREREVQRLRIAFEAQQKEDEIQIKNQNIKLLGQNAKIQEERLRNANLSAVMAAVVALFLILVSVLILSKYRQNARNSREIEHKNTVITEKNQILEHLLNEKEWLLKEVHHRVKNNLHTIICLLESQASYLDNEALQALETSQNRIYAMSLIHQKLYQSDDIKTVDMKSYFADFLLFLSETFGTSQHIAIIQQIDPVNLPTSQAVPLALIVNEGVTNAFKHAFPSERDGVIRVSLHQYDGRLSLMIEDDGIGWNEESYDTVNSLGIQLMKGLSDDLGAEIFFENHAGTRISLVLKFNATEREATHSSLFA